MDGVPYNTSIKFSIDLFLTLLYFFVNYITLHLFPLTFYNTIDTNVTTFYTY